MNVQRFLIAYFGVVAVVGASGAATVHVMKQRHAASVTAVAPPVAPPLAVLAESAPHQQRLAAVDMPLPVPPLAPAAPATRLVVPPLAQHQVPPARVTIHASKARSSSSRLASATVASRSGPRQMPPPNIGALPHYAVGPYAAAWPPQGAVMAPRQVQQYPYNPYPYYSYGYYPRPSYYPTF